MLLASWNLLSVVVPRLVVYQAEKELITVWFMLLAVQTSDIFSHMVNDLIFTQDFVICQMAQHVSGTYRPEPGVKCGEQSNGDETQKYKSSSLEFGI